VIYVVGAGGFGREVTQWARDAGLVVDRLLDQGDDDLDFTPADWFLCGLGEPALKKVVCERLKSRGARFRTLVHPTATIAPNATIGEGAIVCPHAVVSVDAVVGRLVTINCAATVGHDTVVGDYTSISSHADICGHARLGEGVLMGSHASILPHAVAGDWSIVGSGSVVVKEAPAKSTVMGVPASVIYTRRQ
jgi:sugar O-acyltransferase (sialic acid O-acetyltransferase NeuD family)